MRNRFAELREKLGITQRVAAYEIGVTERQWSKWENGKAEPREVYIRGIEKMERRADREQGGVIEVV